MQSSSAQENHDFEISLRDQLIAAQNGQPPPVPQQATQGSEQYPPPPHHAASPHEHQHLDPAIGGQHMSPYAMPQTGPPATDGDGSPASKKAAAKQRELSTTKRAAQNRAAQRAFRQRKEQYICQLEEDIKKYKGIEDDFTTLQADNHALRNYIMDLQGRLSENKIDFPPAPPIARVALPPPPNPVVYDLGPSEGASTAQQPRYSPQDDQQQYHPDLRSDPREQLRQFVTDELNQQNQNAAHPNQAHQPPEHHRQNQVPPVDMNSASPTNGSTEEALPAGAVQQLRAAAAQAGELNAYSPSTRGPPEGEYTSVDDRPPSKRPRVELATQARDRDLTATDFPGEQLLA
ncbi:hypothetical protein BDV97DRAFT_399278 [Delphinella strobiligena]|nr:hypothetical protein BDV97DRAFT_399278 [Delphinella strobiligena]